MANGSDLLLTYNFSQDPTPIQVGTAQMPTAGRLNVNVRSVGPVYCNQLILAVPVGLTVDDLFSATPAGSLSTQKWSITTLENVPASELGLSGNIVYTKFTFDCISSSDFLINYDLTLSAFGPVTNVPGAFTIMIGENSGTTNDPPTFTLKRGGFTFGKVLPQFWLKNFISTAPNTPTVPVTEFAGGSPIVFEWESNGTFFQIFQKNQAAPIYAGTGTTFTLTSGITRHTTFILVASVTGNPAEDTPSAGYEPVYLYDSLTLTVSNPALTPASANIAGTLIVAQGTTLAALTATSATVRGAVNVGGNVGIGTQEPRTELHIRKGDAGGSHYLQYEALVTIENNADSGLALQTPTNNFARIFHATPLDGDSAGIAFDGSNRAIRFFTMNGTERMCIDNLGKVGVGTKTPEYALDVPLGIANFGGMLIGGASLDGTNAPDNAFLRFGASNVILNAAQSGSIYLGYDQGQDIHFGPGGNVMVLKAGGDISVPWGNLYVGGNLYKQFPNVGFLSLENHGGDNRWAQWSSDSRLKCDVQPVQSALDKVRQLRGVTFHWNEDAKRHFTRHIDSALSAGPNATEEQHKEIRQKERDRQYKELAVTNVGVIAQDVEAVLPEAVTTDEAGYKSVRYHELIPLLIEAVKEQAQTVKDLSRLVAQQQEEIARFTASQLTVRQQGAELATMKAQVAALEAAVQRVAATRRSGAPDGKRVPAQA
jgi:hypothetical protein